MSLSGFIEAREAHNEAMGDGSATPAPSGDRSDMLAAVMKARTIN